MSEGSRVMKMLKPCLIVGSDTQTGALCRYNATHEDEKLEGKIESNIFSYYYFTSNQWQ